MNVIKDFPAGLQNGSNDYVNYSYRNPAKSADGEKKVEGSACYSSVMESLELFRLSLHPHKDKTARLPSDCYHDWIGICIANGLIPPEVEYGVKDDTSFLIIPEGCYDRHWVYMTLCCYRWSDAHAKMVWQIVQHVKNGRDFTFWQALHYGLAMHSTYGVGHSFCYVNNAQATPYNPSLLKFDLAQTLAVPILLSYSVKARKRQIKQRLKSDRYSGAYTNEWVKKIADGLGGYVVKSEEVPYPSSSQTRTVQTKHPNLKIGDIHELIGPKWTPLYEMSNPTKETLKAAYDRIK